MGFTGRWRGSHLVLSIGAVLSLALLLAVPADAQPQDEASAPLSPDAPLADPVVRSDAVLTASRASAWTENGVHHLLLEGDVRFEMGAYGFRAQRAVVRIDLEDAPGRPIRHLALYLDDAQPLRGAGPVSAQAQRLLVTATTRGGVTLNSDALDQVAQAPADELVAEAAQRVRRHRSALRQGVMEGFSPQALFPADVQERREARQAEVAREQLAAQASRLPRAGEDERERAETTPSTPPAVPATPGTVAEATVGADAGGEPVDEAPVEVSAAEPVLPTQGAVYLSYDRAVGSADDNYLMLIGDVRVVYQDLQQQRTVALKAERAVLFTRAREGETNGSTARGELDAGDVEGVYLEDNVSVTDGDFTVRAPRMYFDLQQNKAVLLEAVMYAWDVKRQVPLYLRADVVRQTSATNFEAENALLTTSAFAEPHFAIATDRVTVKRQPEGEGAALEAFTASHNRLQWGGVPIFYWPYLAAANRDAPLKSIRGGYSSDEGPMIETTWDLFALSGQPRPQGVELLARVDYRGDHGPAFGLLSEYDRPGMFGYLDSYLLIDDRGEDELADREDLEHDGDTRGFFRWQHRQDLERGWELSLETSYVSDETFLEEFDREEAYNARDYETSAYLKKQQDNWSASLLAKYDFNNFIPQLTTLQTPGYLVDKMPELAFHQIGNSLFDDRVTYFTENRLSRMRLVFGDDDPADRGFELEGAMLNFGIAPQTNFDDAAEAAGLPDDWIHRFDSRHELNVPLQMGIFNVTPYAVGRFTGYDDDFDEYSDEDDHVRLWGQIGTRATTQFTAVYDDVSSRLFDVNRLRHVIEPSVDVFVSDATLDSEDLPVYDQRVENLDEGAGIRFGLTNTLQTQRGGPGRWRSVDWIRLRTDLVLRENDEDRFGDDDDTQIARFFRYRPEYSIGGDHFYTELLWLVSDTLGVVGELTHDFESDKLAQWRVGMSIQHNARLSSYVDYEEIDVLDLELLSYGFTYQLTTKYRVGFRHRLDFAEGRSRGITLSVERKLPRWQLHLVGDHDEIDNETTLGIVLIPEGFDVRAPRIPLDDLFQPR